MNSHAHFTTAALARALIASLFVVSGIEKALHFEATALWLGSCCFAPAEVVLGAAIVLEVSGGIAFAMGAFVLELGLLLAGFTTVVTVLLHDFWSVPAEQMLGQTFHALKNMAVVGGLLAILRQRDRAD